MRVAVICEYSGTVRDAFIARGHDATSYDIIDTESPGPHLIGDAMNYPVEHWEQYDLAICHPPCTHLAVSGARWFEEKRVVQKDALEFVRYLMKLPVDRIAIENPVSIISSNIRKPDQIIQPWMFGHGETKATCLWLKNLPLLKPTNIVEGRENRVHMGCGHGWNTEECKRERSRTFQGIADAMADQWGNLKGYPIQTDMFERERWM